MDKNALKIALALETSARLVETGRKDAESHFVEAEVLWGAAETLGVDEAVGAYLFDWQLEMNSISLQPPPAVIPASSLN
jgi:hypothetical protein